MKNRTYYIALLIAFSFASFSFAQKIDTSFKKDWILIDSLVTKNNAPKSALKKVDIVYAKAKKQQKYAQVVKSLIYKMELGKNIMNNNIQNNIQLLNTEIATMPSTAAKSILWCLLAKQYNEYYNNNRWQIDRRSETTEKKKDDIAVWSKDDFAKQIFNCFDKSVATKNDLQNVNLNDFDVLIIYGTDAELRPTLYDILAHEALEYYKDYNSYSYYGNENSSSKINDINALATEERFLKANFLKEDANDKALQLFQQLIAFHKKDKNPNPTIDVAIERISWVYSKANFTNKDELYIKALEELTANYKANSTAAQAWYLQAKLYSDKANNYQVFAKTANRYEHQKALAIINERLKLNNDSCEGNENMNNLKAFILRKTIATKVESVNVPNQPLRMLVNFRNVDKLYYRIIRLKTSLANNNEDEDTYNNDDKFWNKIVKKAYVKQVEQNLPLAKDYQQHNCEVKVDALQAGTYAILTSTSANFDVGKDKLSYLQFSVSSLSYIENNGDLFVVDRDKGNPIQNATVKAFKQYWDYEKRKTVYTELPTNKTNEIGFAKIKQPYEEYANNLTYMIYKDADTLISRNSNYYISFNREDRRTEKQVEQDNAQIYFYTDRSIYRPEQTIYFKGIVTTKNKGADDFRIFNNMPVNKVYLRNVNGKNIDSLEVTVNEFGSFNGKFILPKNELTGSFSLTTKHFNGYTNFNVEEYKRPKFFVDFDKQKDIYKLNQTIKITGNAKAYAGNNIDGAKVIYTVTRKARFENVWYFWRMPRPNSAAKQIKNGELKTDANGKFVIDFTAEPDENVDRNTNPIFDYEIKATVTDINGETRENTTNISVGYNSIVLKLDVPEKVNISDFKNIKIIATNLAGESVSTKVDIKIAKLKTPTRVIRERFWERSDTFVISKDEYLKNFPYDEYDNETDKLSWKARETITQDTISTKQDVQSTMYDLKNKLFSSSNSSPLERLGEALLITAATKDNEGNIIETKAYVEVNNNDLTYPQYHSANNTKTSAKAGEMASVGFNTAAQNVFVLKNWVTHNDKPKEETQNNDYSFEEIKNNFIWNKTLDTKGFGMFYAFIKNNRFYSGGSNIELIKPSKKINITYGTFRNKTLPGSKETYTIKLSKENGEKVNAEVLTAMYDASLDQFRGHNWFVPEFEEAIYYSSSMMSKCFVQILAKSHYENQSIFSSILINNKYNKLSSHLFSLMNYDEVVVQVPYGTTIKTAFTGSEAIDNASSAFMGSSVKNKIEIAKFAPPKIVKDEELKDEDIVSELNKPQTPNSKQPNTRKNFNETAFFFPNVYADSNGNYTFSFTMPEALTKWKWLSLAHTKNLDFGVSENSVVTAKPLMVQPNTPRFLREGDVMELTAKIANTTDKEITGAATLELIDATTGNSVDGLFNNVFPLQYFTVAANQSSVVKFPVQVPMNFAKPLTIRIVANSSPKGGGWEGADGEENTIPVLTNKIFLTESLPIYLKSNETNKVVNLKPLFEVLPVREDLGGIMTIEYTANPVWSVVQSLPYLMEYPYECAEQTFNRFFANAMASSIVNNNANIKRVIQNWKNDTTKSFSKLYSNPELKSILLSETPWVLDAESEVEQQKRLSLLLDLDKMQSNINSTIEKLKGKQLSNGAFTWFDGGRENEYITQYIVTGIGKLRLLNALNKEQQKQLDVIASKALKYLDNSKERDYKIWISNKKKHKTVYCGNPTDINYWYMRSMFTDAQLSATLLKAFNTFKIEVNKIWTKENIYSQAKKAITLQRFLGKNNLTKKIINSIKENAIEDTAMGTMHWKQNQYCYYWYQNNFETQALLIQAFAEMNNSDLDIEKMKTWLILNKQTNSWNSTISTSAACYALLNYGSNWANNQQTISIGLPNKTVETNNYNGGYIKQKFENKDLISIEQTQAITITNKSINQLTNKQINHSPSYGAVYFQYFADVNDVKSSTENAPLTLAKKLFIEKNNGVKKMLEPVNDGDELNVGDKLIVRLELRADRQMEFLHLKDMRAANTEPLNVLSHYKWQDGLGYYENTKDASTNFFIDYMQRGTYVFEYPLFITHSGTYSVGLAQIQCMYAPEFISHSNGIKIRVK